MREFDLLRKIRDIAHMKDKNLICGIGDDCAVIDRGEYYELLGADMLVEGDHFRLDWATPEQIGRKALISNVSDILAMGGAPKYMLVSLCLSPRVDEEWVLRLYKGLRYIFKNQILKIKNQKLKSQIPIIGGDITHGERIVINIAMIGEVEKKMCRFRSRARVGDLICVTGTLGASAAGLKFLQKFYSLEKPVVRRKSLLKTFNADFSYINDISLDSIFYCVKKHIEPSVPLDFVYDFASYASAMIDVSDGLGSEVRHICEESGVGCLVDADKILIDRRVRDTARFLGHDALDYAVSGGEDFEMVFTIGKAQYEKLIRRVKPSVIFVVGEIVKKKEGIVLIKEGRKLEMPSGFEHVLKGGILNLGTTILRPIFQEFLMSLSFSPFPFIFPLAIDLY